MRPRHRAKAGKDALASVFQRQLCIVHTGPPATKREILLGFLKKSGA